MKVSLNFSNIKDADLSLKFKGIGSNMKANIHLFPGTPVDPDKFLALVDEYAQAMIDAVDGGKKAISQRNKLRGEATKLATLLGHFVGYVAGEDLGTVYAGGFEPASKYRLLPKPLPKTDIDKVVRGPNSGTALAYINPISRSHGKVVYYELGYAEKKGDKIGELTVITTTVARFPILIKNLTPGTTYIFQTRATNKVGFNDWSDPLNFMAT